MRNILANNFSSDSKADHLTYRGLTYYENVTLYFIIKSTGSR